MTDIETTVAFDLAKKCQTDIHGVIGRILSIAPSYHTEIISVAALVPLNALAHAISNDLVESNDERLLLAALISVRCAQTGDGGCERALKDLAALRSAGLTGAAA